MIVQVRQTLFNKIRKNQVIILFWFNKLVLFQLDNKKKGNNNKQFFFKKKNNHNNLKKKTFKNTKLD